MFEADQSTKRFPRPERGGIWASRIGVLLLAALLAMLAMQSARLIWALGSPVGPVGPPALASARSAAVIDGFDPFFRLQPASTSNAVTSLPLKLFGTRRDSATGQGSAIIATPDGIQSSYAVGEILMPGVKLWAVGSDEVTLDRGGSKEKLFLDQSVPAPVAQPSASPTAPLPPPIPIQSVVAPPAVQEGGQPNEAPNAAQTLEPK
jgi:general secretion pathway protein C